jgi:putative ABC transport system permease protein
MVNALLLHPYNFGNLDSLVRVREDRGIDEGIDARYLAPADAEELRAEQQVFEKLTTYRMQSFSMGAGSDIQPVLGCRVSADFFDVLGVRPATGRLFTAGEEQPGLDQVAIMGHGLWQRRFGGDPQLLNKTRGCAFLFGEIAGIFRRSSVAHLCGWLTLCWTQER